MIDLTEVKVHLKHENKYLMFYQKKYGLDHPAYATVGGLFNVGETPEECAHRELLEETGLITDRMIPLGKYRVQVNRGGGYLYAYLAYNCTKSPTRLVSDDYEKQQIHLLSHQELLRLTREGKIGEAQWAATTALGLLWDAKS